MPEGHKAGTNGFKPTFGTVNAGAENDGALPNEATQDSHRMENGGSSSSSSRHVSDHSRRASPRRTQEQLPSPNGQIGPLDPSSPMRFGSGPYGSRPIGSHANAPSPQAPSTPNHSFPRPPRGSFNGRGRGFRYSPAGSINANGGNLYQRGFGMGYPQPFPPAQNYAPNGLYDPMQAQYVQTPQMYGRGPPPPMPQTAVPNLDAMRFYVLGQVSEI